MIRNAVTCTSSVVVAVVVDVLVVVRKLSRCWAFDYFSSSALSFFFLKLSCRSDTDVSNMDC